jgi:hypothetical protein
MKIPKQSAPVSRQISSISRSNLRQSGRAGVTPSDCSCTALPATFNGQKVVNILPNGGKFSSGCTPFLQKPQCSYIFNQGTVTPICNCVQKNSRILSGGLQVDANTGALLARI